MRWQVRAEWGEEEKMGWKQARISVQSLMKKKECEDVETNEPSQRLCHPPIASTDPSLDVPVLNRPSAMRSTIRSIQQNFLCKNHL